MIIIKKLKYTLTAIFIKVSFYIILSEGKIRDKKVMQYRENKIFNF